MTYPAKKKTPEDWRLFKLSCTVFISSYTGLTAIFKQNNARRFHTGTVSKNVPANFVGVITKSNAIEETATHLISY